MLRPSGSQLRSRLIIRGDEDLGLVSSEEVWTSPVIYSPSHFKVIGFYRKYTIVFIHDTSLTQRFFGVRMNCIVLRQMKNKTNRMIESYSHPSAIENKVIHCLK